MLVHKIQQIMLLGQQGVYFFADHFDSKNLIKLRRGKPHQLKNSCTDKSNENGTFTNKHY